MRKPTRSSKKVSLNNPENSGVILAPTLLEVSSVALAVNVAFIVLKIEWARRGDVDGRTDAAAGHIGATGFVHLDSRNAVGGEILEIEGTRRSCSTRRTTTRHTFHREISRHGAAVQK